MDITDEKSKFLVELLPGMIANLSVTKRLIVLS